MEEETIVTPQEEVKAPETQEVEEAQPAEVSEEANVGDIFNEQPTKKEDGSVPLATYLDLKKSYKGLDKEVKELRESIKQGATKKEIASDLKDIAERHNVDEDFLEEFALAIKSKAEQDLKEEFASTLRPMQEKQKAEKIDKIFNEHFDKALEQMPEYKEIVNKEVIKSLSLDPRNKDKTFSQIIEESFGHLVTGKKTLETSTPRGGKNDNQEIDYSKTKDPLYFKEIMSNPSLKKKYNEGLIERLHL